MSNFREEIKMFTGKEKKANFPPHKNKDDIYNLPTEII